MQNDPVPFPLNFSQIAIMRLLPFLFLIFSYAAWGGVLPNCGQSGSFVWPTEGRVINGFDPMRKGIDIAGKAGQPVVAACDGKVLSAKNARGFGNLIIIQHRGSMVTAYAHNKSILVREGQTVTQGQQIAEMGNSDADTVKLSFQIRHMEKPIDPMTLLPLSGQNLQTGNQNPPTREDLAAEAKRVKRQAAVEELLKNVENRREKLRECELSEHFFGDSGEFLARYLPNLVHANIAFPTKNPFDLVVLLNIDKETGQIKLDEERIDEQRKEQKNPIFDAFVAAVGRAVSHIESIPPEFASLSKILFRVSTDHRCYGAAKELNVDRRRYYNPNQFAKREIGRSSKKIFSISVKYQKIDDDGTYIFEIKTGVDTASLKINGEEQGGKFDGSYSLKRVARAGLESHFVIDAKDLYGNTASEKITINRSIVESIPKYVALNPANVKRVEEKNSIAIIIGIQNYRRLAKAEFADNDARIFYDYAIRALGIRPENIKMLVDDQADQLEIYKTLDHWLPTKVAKQKTEIYLFYSGHGLPSDDGKSLYLLPTGVDKDYLSKTAINLQEVISSLNATQAKSVTIFMDACYSGQARSGETLVANARPVTLKAEKKLFPDDFTVITASQADQISSSSPDLKHGIFSYFLMKGMEGDADANKDGRITLGEMQAYLVENVGRQAGMMSRKQEPQLIGDSNRVLVGQ